VEEILKVMTEPLPTRLSPLAPELTKFFQKDKEASATESPAKPKKMKNYPSGRCHSSDTATDVKNCHCRNHSHRSRNHRSRSHRSRSYQSRSHRSRSYRGTTEAEATGTETGITEDPNLETTLGDIDNILLRMAEEEATAVAVNTTTEKGKEQIEDTLEEENFNFQDILGQELTNAEK
jgi:hypothetical protein